MDGESKKKEIEDGNRKQRLINRKLKCIQEKIMHYKIYFKSNKWNYNHQSIFYIYLELHERKRE